MSPVSPTVPVSAPISDHEKLRCAEREVRQRMRVYGRLVHLGHMRQQTADREIEVMQAIAEDYRRKVGAPSPAPAAAERGLFDPLEP